MSRGLFPQSHAVRRDEIAHELDRLRRWYNVAFRADGQAKLRSKECRNSLKQHFGLVPFANDGKIVHISQIEALAQGVLHELIKAVKVNIRRFLTGQVSDGHTDFVQPSITRAIVNACALWQSKWQVWVVDDRAYQPKKPLIVGDLGIDSQDYLMIYSVEILADIAFHNGPVFCIRLSAGELYPFQQALCRCKRSLVLAATIAVLDEPFFHVWIDLPIDRPLHDAVSKSERHNETRFRVSHIELSVITDCIAPVKKLALDFQQIFFQSEAESNNFVAIPLAASGFAVCREEIIKRTDAIFQVMQLFQKSHSVLLRVAFPLCVGCRVVLRAAIAFRPSGRFAAMPATIVSGLFIYRVLPGRERAPPKQIEWPRCVIVRPF